MKKIIFLLILVPIIFISCMQNSEKYALIGRKGVIEYYDTKVRAEVYYQTETELHWEVVYEDGKEASGDESVNYERLSDDLHFLNWIEKDGTTISQVINTRTGGVKTFWSFSEEESIRGGRSSMFLDGKFTFDE